MNNRQANNGRRRGRGGQRQQGGGNPNQGNRIDNRARGNAAQLLEKYKNLARDAQMQGDRVNTEYYLQFADHYFRVLAESRSRFEEQNPGQQQGRRPSTDIDAYDDEFEGEGAEGERGNEAEQGDEQPFERQSRDDRPRRERDNRRDRDGREHGNREQGREGRERGERRDQPQAEAPVPTSMSAPAPVLAPANEDEAPQPPRRRGRPRRVDVESAAAESDNGGIAAVLPPALGVEGEVVVEAKPRRRRVKKDEGEPAAAE
jgi:hypothetical protein